MTQDDAVQSALEKSYFLAAIEVLRAVLEKDEDGDTRTLKNRVVATIPGRIVRGKDPLLTVEAERSVSVKNWEIRLSLRAIAKLEKEQGCFNILSTDTLRDKKSRIEYRISGNDTGRTEEKYLSVFCVQVSK